MGLHKRHTHGRVFRGLEAREQLHIHKRDSHGDRIKMNVPEGFQQKAADNSDVQTAQEVVYVTLPQTFSGSAMYSTLTGSPTPAAQTSARSTQAADDAESTNTRNNANNGHSASASTATVTPSEVGSAAATSLAAATAIAHAGQSTTPSFSGATAVAGSPIRASNSPTSQAIQQDSTNSGMTSGGRAGLAIGLILGLALVAGLFFFCWRRRKNPRGQEELNDEKHSSFVDAGARRVEAGGNRDSAMTERSHSSLRSTRTASTAPRLSLRPTTQFLPSFGGDNRKSGANSLDVAAAGLSEKPKSVWERSPSNVQQNPFDDAPVVSEKQARPDSPPSNPFDEPEGKRSTDSRNTITPTAAAATEVTATAAAIGSTGHSSKSSWEGTEPPTPKSTKFGTAAAVPVAGGAVKDVSPPRGPNNVHRVQLDFKPSMEDELELRSGQLVRMLHEYDDGWALCIRMDRSQQGVTPRTCLSKLPVKPRPQGPPPNSRPGTAQGPRRPANPSHPPNGPLNGAMYPRPLTPTQASQSSSPTEMNGEASTSPSGVPTRKPVPGQAM